uniref:secretion-regulating guanine nucleotide exchange factor isoform X6 n=1 Tax=Arvicanthis niloticus TaxID=61156 RepID=UPI0014863F61|nr:secretion-regulating guanine nucleotide exchange factor isoform X6 [Arvicanthis niloticus]
MFYTHERGGIRDSKHMLDVAVLSIKYQNCNRMHDFFNGSLLDYSGGVLRGANSYGQLGLGHKEDVFLPQQLSDFCKPGCIKSVTGGGGHSVVVTDGGGLFVCGLNKDGQLGLGHTEEVLCFTICKPLFGCPIRQVACGWDFTIMLTERGQVLSCGSNAFGQLGVPHGPHRCVVPQVIECLREKVVCVAAGLRHALATTESGKVFTWGRADYGQLGRRLESPEAQKPVEQDSPFTFQRSQKSVPSPLHCLTGAAEISCGSEHNLAVIRDKCCSWGWNEHGMCGDGTESNVWTPTPVQALPSPSRLLLVGCGAGHSLALCQMPAHPAPCQDLKVTCPLPDATENTESQGATDRNKLEGEMISDFNPKQF